MFVECPGLSSVFGDWYLFVAFLVFESDVSLFCSVRFSFLRLGVHCVADFPDEDG